MEYATSTLPVNSTQLAGFFGALWDQGFNLLFGVLTQIYPYLIVLAIAWMLWRIARGAAS